MKVLRLLALAGLCLIFVPQLSQAQGRRDVDLAVSPTPLFRYYSIPTQLQLGVIVSNNGNQTVKSFKLFLAVDGGTPSEREITLDGSGMATGQYLNQVIPFEGAPNVSEARDYAIRAWIGEIKTTNNPSEGVDDMVPTNSEINWTVKGVAGRSGTDKKVLLEEFTGAWCQWCPSGFDVVQDLLELYPDRFIPVMIHNRDQMSFAEGDLITQASQVSGFPTGQIDRFTFGAGASALGVGGWKGLTESMLNAFTPVDFTMTSSYDEGTRQAQIDLEAEFLTELTGDFRFNVYVVEDNLTGTGTGWDQVNALHGNANYRNSRYFNAGNPIRGHIHNHVLRQVVGGVNGEKGDLTNTVAPGTTYSHTFTFTLSNNFKAEDVSFVGFVHRNSTNLAEREVYNARSFHTDGRPASVKNKNLNVMALNVFPNPTSEQVNVKFELKHNKNVTVRIIDMMGREVKSEDLGMQNAGSVERQISLSGCTPGNYFVSVTAGDHTHLEQIIVQ